MYGTFTYPALPFARHPAGINLGNVVVSATGSNTLYVRSGGPADYDDPALTGRILPTLASALAQCRAGKNDMVILLPGHTESFTDNTAFANLMAGTRIVGTGRGVNMPVLRLTNTAGSFLLNKADVVITGVRFRLEGANGITKGIVVTGADCVIGGCDIEVASGAALKSAIAIELGAGSDRCQIIENKFRGTATHNVTDCIKVAAAVDQVEITGNRMAASATAANGLIHVTAAATGLIVSRNIVHNTHTASTAAIKVDDVACSGFIVDNHTACENNGTASAQGVVFAGVVNATIKCSQNFSVDEPGKSGILAPVAAT